ncbi:ceramide synthase 4-like isoform X3 [Notamacropus eugenii]|uniref:ceramide synthase 4-like isoform X3 n=1 Tax=Notamacropus eugenii TaxID=9315 RepID=UPI003B67D864
MCPTSTPSSSNILLPCPISCRPCQIGCDRSVGGRDLAEGSQRAINRRLPVSSTPVSSHRFIWLSLGRALGVRDSIRIKATPNPILESFFQTQSKNPKKDELDHLASQCSLSVRQAERWFLHRRNQKRPLLSKKFSESCSKFVFYSCSSFGGLFIFCNETWFGQPETIWNGYPKQASKMLNYAKWDKAKNIMFIIFAVVFFISRLIFFPNKVIYTSYHVLKTNNQLFFGYYFSISLLLVSLSLNLYWSLLILKMLYKCFSEGQVKNDARSDTEELDLNDEQLTVREQSNGRLQFNDVTDIRARRGQGTGQLTEAVPVA